MKKFLLSLFAFCVSLTSFANITLNGIEYTIDTLSMYPVGPGSTFYELRMLRIGAKGRLDCWLMTVDTKNPYITIEQVLAKDQLVGTERPSAMAERKTTDKKIFFGGTNGDFFATTGDVGRPVGFTVVNNEFAYIPIPTDRKMGGVDEQMRGVIAKTMEYSGALVLEDTTLNIAHVNYGRQSNELVLFNQHNGATTNTNAYGTELLIELLPDNMWGTNATIRAKVTDKQTQIGSMAIPDGQAVLSGHGTMAAELEKLNVGDEVTIQFSLKLDGVVTNLSQCIGADPYELIVENGEVPQSGYWDENHPRTAFGASEDASTLYFLVVDGRGVSYGCTTKVLGEIIKHYGAYRAANWDGGGSSCLYIRNLGQMNNGSDGSERACGNGMFAVANVPEVDNTIAAIAPYMPIYSLPRYGVAMPKFLGYNKYGVMIDTDVQGVTLSCAPELGEILEDGRFLASGEKGGTLYAHLGDISTELEIRLSTSAPVAIRLDSVLCDAAHPYEVEVQGRVGNAQIDLLASALDWTSLNPEVASVDERGIITGVSNGATQVIGRLGEFADTILVNVEIPTGVEMVWDDFRDAASWTIQTSSDYGAYLSVPEETNAPVNFKFNYTGGRSPYVQLAKYAPIYSRPDTIRIPLTTDANFSKINVAIRANNASQAEVVTIESVIANEELIINVPVADVFGTDVAIFPLHFELMKMFIDSKATSKAEHYVTLNGITQIYGKKSQTSKVENVTTMNTESAKFVENGQLFILYNDQVYTILGTQR